MRMPLPPRMTPGSYHAMTAETTRDPSVITSEEPVEPNMDFDFNISPECLNLSMDTYPEKRRQIAAKTPEAATVIRQSRFRRKQARPRRRPGDYVAEDLMETRTLESQVTEFSKTSNEDLSLKADSISIFQRNSTLEDVISAYKCTISPSISPFDFSPEIPPPSADEGNACSTPSIYPPFTNGFVQHSHRPGLGLGLSPVFGRHRAQHSAPRGGPPRAWSNADLTEALNNVWNKNMTTSQASRIFGIPYNSLLMYVRGKYGKSLKLDVLKKGLDMEKKRSRKSTSKDTSTFDCNPFSQGVFGVYLQPRLT